MEAKESVPDNPERCTLPYEYRHCVYMYALLLLHHSDLPSNAFFYVFSFWSWNKRRCGLSGLGGNGPGGRVDWRRNRNVSEANARRKPTMHAFTPRSQQAEA